MSARRRNTEGQPDRSSRAFALGARGVLRRAVWFVLALGALCTGGLIYAVRG